MGQAAGLGIVRRAFEQDVPHRQQRRAVETRAVAFVIAQAGGLVALRHLHLAFQQQPRRRFFFVLTGTDLQRQTQFSNALLEQFANHQRPSGLVDRLFTAFGRVILKFLGHRLRGDRHPVDADDRPLLLTAGDQLWRFILRHRPHLGRLELHRPNRLHIHHRRHFCRGTATTAPATTATSASTRHDLLLRTSAERFDNDAPGTRPAH
jgi:hypothetical protein